MLKICLWLTHFLVGGCPEGVKLELLLNYMMMLDYIKVRFPLVFVVVPFFKSRNMRLIYKS